MNDNNQLLHSPDLPTRTINDTSIDFMHHVSHDEALFIPEVTDPFNNMITTTTTTTTTTTIATTMNNSPALSMPSPITSSYNSNSSTPLSSSPKSATIASPTTSPYVNGQPQPQQYHHQYRNDNSSTSCHQQQPNVLLDDEAYFQLSEYLAQSSDNIHGGDDSNNNNNHSLSLEEEMTNEMKEEPMPSSPTLNNLDGLQIRVIGAPDKSRVETQTRLCIQLVTTNGTKVTSWPCLKLPEQLLARSRLKKSFQQQQRSDNDLIHQHHQQMVLSDESSLLSKTIYLDAKVVCASQPDQPVKVCSGCIQRERKRAERSKNGASQHKNNNNNNAGQRSIIDNIPEQDRILLFNCGPMVNFSSGDAILPTRITCYCRHHNEKIGFRIQFAMKNGHGDTIAMGMSPPILITDDHKSTRQKNRKRDRTNFESKSTTKNGCQQQQQQQKVRKLPLNRKASPVTPAASRRGSLSINIMDNDLPSLESGDPNDLSILDSQSSSPITNNAIANAFHSSSLPTPGEERNNPYGNSLSSFFPLPPLSSSGIDPTLNPTLEHRPISCPTRTTTITTEHPYISPEHSSSSTSSPTLSSPTNNTLTPQLERLVPAQGPTYGGCEVTVLGSNFYRGLTCLFGEHQATTVFWNPNTLVCVLPPAAHPGPVVVSFKQHSLILEGHDVPLFTYYDANDQALLELALQVVGLKMTGKLQDAKQIAMRIVQGGDNLLQQQQQQQQQNGSGNHNSNGNNNNNNCHSGILAASHFQFVQSSCSSNPSGASRGNMNKSGAFNPDSSNFLRKPLNDTLTIDTSDPLTLEDKMIQIMDRFQVTANDLLHVRTPITHHTLLHLAAWGGYTKLAMKIIHLCPQALHATDRNGLVPLALAHIKEHNRSIVLDTMVQANNDNNNYQLSKSSIKSGLFLDRNENDDKRQYNVSSPELLSPSVLTSSIMLQDPSLFPYSRTTLMSTENLSLSRPTSKGSEETTEEIKNDRLSNYHFKPMITTRNNAVSEILPYSFCSSITPLLVGMRV